MQIVPFNNYLKPTSGQKEHITYSDYKQLREFPFERIESIKQNALTLKTAKRDQLLMDFMWETGGRIGDIVRIRKEHIDSRNKILTLHMNKTKKEVKINLSTEMCLDYLDFYSRHGEPFAMTRQNAWRIINIYGAMLGKKLHPHMFRHGLAIHMLSKGIDIQVIAYRLGHSDPRTTARFYCVITPELEKQYYEAKGFKLR